MTSDERHFALGFFLIILGAVLLVLAAEGCGGSVHPPRAGKWRAQDVKDQSDRARAVYTRCPSGQNYSASAVQYDEHHIITAAHVFACGSAEITVQISQISFIEAEPVIAIGDFMVLRTSTAMPKKPPVKLAKSYPYRGEQICTESMQPVKRRLCVRVEALLAGHIMHDGRAIQGNSGGGVYNERGELVGVVSTVGSMYTVPLGLTIGEADDAL